MTGHPQTPPRLDWASSRDRIDLVEVAIRLLGAPPGRKGSKGTWWICPIHDDRNPSLQVRADIGKWRCFGCGEHGDAASLVMKLNPGMTFPEAVRLLVGDPSQPGRTYPTPRPNPAPAPTPPPVDVTLRAAVLDLIAEASQALWRPEGEEALSDLRRRGLDDATITDARLGGVVGERRLASELRDRPVWCPEGVLVPWFKGPALALAKIRRFEGLTPKYVELYRSDPIAFPGLDAIRPGRPLVVVEGEFDAILLGQVLGDRASVITLGPASERPDSRVVAAALVASPWLIATDADPAGDKLAEAWAEAGACRRIRPAEGPGDWCEMFEWGVDLGRYWIEVLAGVEAPELFAWEELAKWRWEPGIGDLEPGIVIEAPPG